jgi:glycerol uptake facilitator protein
MVESTQRSVVREIVAEAIGTGILVFFGVGAVHVAVLSSGLVGLWQVAAVWGIGIGLAIYATATISGAHLNPAVTIALTAYRKFPLARTGPHIAAQLFGAVVAAWVLYSLFHPLISSFEARQLLVRGAAGSELSAMVYGEYFPNPALIGTSSDAFDLVPLPAAACAEALGTALLVFFIFALTDQYNENRPGRGGVALCIGLIVTALICIIAPLTQAGLNPARDFGPRLVAYFAGWGRIAIPGPRGGFFVVYILAPILGALAGGGAYDLLLRPAMERMHRAPEEPAARDPHQNTSQQSGR